MDFYFLIIAQNGHKYQNVVSVPLCSVRTPCTFKINLWHMSKIES